MELVPWRPFGRELSPFRREVENLWSRFFSEVPFIRAFKEEWSPTVDVSEKKDIFLIKAELPGVDEKDVSVSISGDILTIKGEKKKVEEAKKKKIEVKVKKGKNRYRPSPGRTIFKSSLRKNGEKSGELKS